MEKVFVAGIALFCGLLAVNGKVEAKPGNASIYVTQENEAKIMSMYEAKLAAWPVPYEEAYVKTRYGTTHVIMSGPKEAPPLVLIHAMGVTSTMWLPNIAALSREYRVYAVDTIGDFGKSGLTTLIAIPGTARSTVCG